MYQPTAIFYTPVHRDRARHHRTSHQDGVLIQKRLRAASIPAIPATRHDMPLSAIGSAFIRFPLMMERISVSRSQST